MRIFVQFGNCILFLGRSNSKQKMVAWLPFQLRIHQGRRLSQSAVLATRAKLNRMSKLQESNITMDTNNGWDQNQVNSMMDAE